MIKIPIVNTNLFALVDDEYEAKLNEYKWYLNERVKGYRYCHTTGGLLMHRLIMDLPGKLFVDHINGDGLDNRRSNLRLCTNSQNQANSKIRKDNKTGLKGVQIDGWALRKGRKSIYRASIQYQGKTIRIGRYETPELAKKVYDKKAQELFGDFARIG